MPCLVFLISSIFIFLSSLSCLIMAIIIPLNSLSGHSFMSISLETITMDLNFFGDMLF